MIRRQGHLMDKRVLIVDDDAPIRSMVATVLRRQDFSVDVCENGEEALARIDTDSYGALVLALVQFDSSGDEIILRRIREKPLAPRIIVLSAGPQSLLDSAESELICARLRKPFEIDELIQAVSSCFL
jgi:DNA-binding response OmpR family regulator